MQSIPSSNRNRNKPIKHIKNFRATFLNTSLNIPKNQKSNFSPSQEVKPNKIKIKKGNTIINNENHQHNKQGMKGLTIGDNNIKNNKPNQIYPLKLVNKIEIDLMYHRIEVEQKFRASKINLNYHYPRNQNTIDLNSLDDEDESIDSFPNICIS